MIKIKKTVRRNIIIAVVCIAVIGGAFAIYRAVARKNRTAPVSFNYSVKTGSIKSTVSAIGTISPSDTRYITAPDGSTVLTVNCTEGQTVKSGDTLFTLSNDQTKLDLKKSQINLSQLQNSLKSLKDQKSQLIIYSTVGGIVKAVNASTGDSVSPQMGGQSGLIQIEDTSVMKLTISGNDPTISEIKINIGQSVQAVINGKNKTLKLLSNSKESGMVFQVMDKSGLSWDSNYNVTKLSGKDVNATGLTSGDVVTVNPKQSGTIANIYVSAGSTVKKGQKLIATKSDNIDNQIQTAEVNIESAQLDVSDKQKSVDALTVKAPVDGVVFNIQVKAGDEVGTSSSASSASSSSSSGNANSSSANSSSTTASSRSSQTSVSSSDAIATIENRSAMQVIVPVDELDIGNIKVGQSAEITADAFKDKVYNGKVSNIAANGTVQNGSATFNVTIDIDSPSGLKTGMTANVSIITASKDNVLLVPIDAVQDIGSNKYVEISEGNSVTRKKVEIGIVNSDYAEVVSGLSDGDKIVMQVRGTSSGSSTQNQFRGFPGMSGQGAGSMGANRQFRQSNN
ncbi:MAG TPA: hypothetical protein DD426_01455 [Clostridiaceae bacterium]|nr:hypothetical protein [Clostridiaceae bacterium]